MTERKKRFVPLLVLICTLIYGAICVAQNKAFSQPENHQPTICIDPGHSKETVGATAHGLKEYQVCWQMAKLLEAELKKSGYRVILTKPNQDANVNNQERAEIANRARVDLLIRLHCDSGPDSGIATFYPAKAGHIRDKTGPSAEVIAQSERCAHLFHTALLEKIQSLHLNLKDRKVRTDMQTAVGAKLGGALEGSIYSERPVLLVEMAVLDSEEDVRLLKNTTSRKHLATALATAVRAAVPNNSPNKSR